MFYDLMTFINYFLALTNHPDASLKLVFNLLALQRLEIIDPLKLA